MTTEDLSFSRTHVTEITDLLIAEDYCVPIASLPRFGVARTKHSVPLTVANHKSKACFLPQLVRNTET
jgi:hypothetical protein